MQRQSSYKVHLNTASNGELSDPLWDSANRGLTLVRLISKSLDWNFNVKVYFQSTCCTQWINILSNEMQIDAGHKIE